MQSIVIEDASDKFSQRQRLVFSQDPQPQIRNKAMHAYIELLKHVCEIPAVNLPERLRFIQLAQTDSGMESAIAAGELDLQQLGLDRERLLTKAHGETLANGLADIEERRAEIKERIARARRGADSFKADVKKAEAAARAAIDVQFSKGRVAMAHHAQALIIKAEAAVMDAIRDVLNHHAAMSMLGDMIRQQVEMQTAIARVMAVPANAAAGG